MSEHYAKEINNLTFNFIWEGKPAKIKKKTIISDIKRGGLKPRPNDRNMPTQHIATLLGATCCVRLATVLQHVGCCWLNFETGQI